MNLGRSLRGLNRRADTTESDGVRELDVVSYLAIVSGFAISVYVLGLPLALSATALGYLVVASTKHLTGRSELDVWMAPASCLLAVLAFGYVALRVRSWDVASGTGLIAGSTLVASALLGVGAAERLRERRPSASASRKTVYVALGGGFAWLLTLPLGGVTASLEPLFAAYTSVTSLVSSSAPEDALLGFGLALSLASLGVAKALGSIPLDRLSTDGDALHAARRKATAASYAVFALSSMTTVVALGGSTSATGTLPDVTALDGVLGTAVGLVSTSLAVRYLLLALAAATWLVYIGYQATRRDVVVLDGVPSVIVGFTGGIAVVVGYGALETASSSPVSSTSDAVWLYVLTALGLSAMALVLSTARKAARTSERGGSTVVSTALVVFALSVVYLDMAFLGLLTGAVALLAWDAGGYFDGLARLPHTVEDDLYTSVLASSLTRTSLALAVGVSIYVVSPWLRPVDPVTASVGLMLALVLSYRGIRVLDVPSDG